jgi:hypothetical protein
MFFFHFYVSLLKRKTNIKILFTSIKTHTIIIKAVLKAAAKFLFRQSFSITGRFCPVSTSYLMLENLRKPTKMSLAVLGPNLRIHRWLSEQLLEPRVVI